MAGYDKRRPDGAGAAGVAVPGVPGPTANLAQPPDAATARAAAAMAGRPGDPVSAITSGIQQSRLRLSRQSFSAADPVAASRFRESKIGTNPGSFATSGSVKDMWSGDRTLSRGSIKGGVFGDGGRLVRSQGPGATAPGPGAPDAVADFATLDGAYTPRPGAAPAPVNPGAWSGLWQPIVSAARGLGDLSEASADMLGQVAPAITGALNLGLLSEDLARDAIKMVKPPATMLSFLGGGK